MADGLPRWARERAPELLARAEAEAVAMLRDALVEAALQGRPQPAQAPPPPAAEPPEAGEALWAYCVLRAGEPVPEEVAGVVEGSRVEVVRHGELAALVSRVPLSEFGAEPLRRNLNDLPWLERVARAHEAVLERALTLTTVVPLRLCTIYETEEGVQQVLERERGSFAEILDQLAGRQEWGVKLLVEPERLAAEARARSDQAAALEQELAGRTEGGAYMQRRRLERHLRDVGDSLAAEIAEHVHARLQDWAIDAVTRPPQNRDLSGHEGEMLLNGAYLVEASRVDALRELVAELEAHHESVGARIELTGPWPPYNFLPRDGSAALA
jgi:hypothetical protein